MAKTMEADEIEVTPEMIEAGERCYRSIDGRFADLEFILTSVFRAMAEASSRDRA